MSRLAQAALFLMAVPLTFAALAEPVSGVDVMGGEEVMFVNGARLRCGSDCLVRVLDDGSMRIGFPAGTIDRALRIEATVQPVRLTLQAEDRWITYLLDDGRSAHFDAGRERDGTEVALLYSRTEAEMLEQERAPHASDARDETGGGTLARTPLGRRFQEVGAR